MATNSYINYSLFHIDKMAERYPTAPQVVFLSRRDCRVCATNATFHILYISIVVTGKDGRAPGELFAPSGVAIHEETHQIFVVNYFNDRVEMFSETGEFLSQLGVGQLYHPYGVATYGDSLYVSCWGDDTVSKFSLTEMCRVRRIGREGSNNEQFDSPRQLTTDLIGRVFIADTRNNRICIYDPDLNHLRNISHESISRPYDVKVSSRDHLYARLPGIYNRDLVRTAGVNSPPTLSSIVSYLYVLTSRVSDVILASCVCMTVRSSLFLSEDRN